MLDWIRAIQSNNNPDADVSVKKLNGTGFKQFGFEVFQGAVCFCEITGIHVVWTHTLKFKSPMNVKKTVPHDEISQSTKV